MEGTSHFLCCVSLQLLRCNSSLCFLYIYLFVGLLQPGVLAKVLEGLHSPDSYLRADPPFLL